MKEENHMGSQPVQQDLSGFMSNMNIQLRNRLSVLLPALDLLDKHLSANGDADPKVKEYLSVAHRTALSVLRMANNMRDYAAYIRDYDLSEPVRFDAADVLRQIVEQTKPLAAGIEITVSCPDEPLLVDCDPEKWQVLVYNLLSNAILHGGGKISITLEASGSDMIMRLHNNGERIGGEPMSRLYEGYSQYRPSAEQKTGLGLPLALAVAGQCNGMLLADSDESGTTMTVSLPVVADGVIDLAENDDFSEDSGIKRVTVPVSRTLLELSDIHGKNPLYDFHPASSDKEM